MTTRSLLLTLLLAPTLAFAQSPSSDGTPAEQSGGREAQRAAAIAKFEASLAFQHGKISLPGDFASLNLSPGFRFLGAADAKRVLVDAWGNPPEAAAKVLGMVSPADGSPLAKDAWAVVITYEKDGYVKDEEADSIDYQKLLEQMQESTAAANDERRKAGYGTVKLVGWAQQPFYDKAAHKLHWAKHLKFDDAPGGTLNYDIRVLGRYGVLSMNAVAGIEQLGQVKQGMQEVLAFTEFNQGHRYADFNSSSDKVAAYGLAALVAGGVAAKMGLFAKLGVLLLSLKKLLIFLVAGAAALIGKLFKGRGREQA
jgi:uncharacterized membrane-anchored protein